MNRVLFLFLLFQITSFRGKAQNDIQTCILTEDGFFTISKNAAGNDMIMMDISLWDQMVCGTKYCSENLSNLSSVNICIQIADKRNLQCNRGIGFRCGIFDCKRRIPLKVNNRNRICSVALQMVGCKKLKLIFLDDVDWESLQNDK